jgi:hypothetical protein
MPSDSVPQQVKRRKPFTIANIEKEMSIRKGHGGILLCRGGAVSLGVVDLSTADLLAQYLDPDEELLFVSDGAEIKSHVGRAHKLAGMYARHGPFTGALAITDRRICVMAISRKHEEANLLLEGVYDSGYAKQRIETNKNRLDGILKEKPGLLGRIRSQRTLEKEGESGVNILTGAVLEKGLLGGEGLRLNIHRVWTGKDLQRSAKLGAGLARVVSLGMLKTDEDEWDLRIKQPVSLAKKFAIGGLVVAGGGTPVSPLMWCAAIVNHFKDRSDFKYEPLLEIMQEKAQEMSELVKELEAAAR